MRKKVLFATVFFLCFSFSFSQRTSNLKQIPIKGFYTNPVVSPNGEFALLTGEHYDGIYLLNLTNYELTTVSNDEGSGYGYSWDEDSEIIYFKKKEKNDYNSNARVYSYSLNRKEISEYQGLNHNYLPSFSGFDKKKKSNIIVYTNTSTLQIEATDLFTSKKWIVTQNDGQFYNAILSHDGTKVAVHNGADIYVYDINGSERGIKIGTGIATSWSSDDTHIIGFLDESTDGHSLTNSDLYLFDASRLNTLKITTSSDVFEMFPCFYGADKILFSDDKTGNLYTINLKM